MLSNIASIAHRSPGRRSGGRAVSSEKRLVSCFNIHDQPSVAWLHLPKLGGNGGRTTSPDKNLPWPGIPSRDQFRRQWPMREDQRPGSCAP